MIDDLIELAETQPSLVLGVIAGIVLLGAFIGFLVGRRKSRPVLGVFVGGLLPVPGLLAMALMPQKESDFY